MQLQNLSLEAALRSVRRTILQVLIGLMGGGCAVWAQQPAASATSSAIAPSQPASAQSAPVEPAPTGQAPAEPATATPPVSAVVASAAPAAPDEPMDKETAKKIKKMRDKFAGKKKPPKQTPMSIVQGTLTVDGWTGKARLNYDIADLKYLYVWVISNGWFAQSNIEENAFSGNAITVDANKHTIQITSEKRLLGKKSVAAFVYVDTGYSVPSKFPVMGYGSTPVAPYAWPGATNLKVVASGAVLPPPLPVELRPVLARAGCAPVGSKQALLMTPCTDTPTTGPRLPFIEIPPSAPASTTATNAPAPATSTPAASPAAKPDAPASH
jgi:hypothetical protein